MMEALADTLWDVLICGTGLQQSLLALALSRSGKNILHIDPNDYYGGSEASFSLQEAEVWASRHSGRAGGNKDGPSLSSPAFSAASVCRHNEKDGERRALGVGTGLASSRAYCLTLAPQFFHARSALIGQLVSSRAYRQLEFVAVASFFIFQPPSPSPDGTTTSRPTLTRVPATREDVFSSTALSARSKRQLMKFLRFVLSYAEGSNEPQAGGSSQEGDKSWEKHADEPLSSFLQAEFNLDESLRAYVLALTLSVDGQITVRRGLARLRRHMTSMGFFGPGFAAVYPKYGGSSEIAQVGCRAAAVGGAVYMLGTGIKEVKTTSSAPATAEGATERGKEGVLEVELTNGVTVKTKVLIRGGEDDDTAPPATAIIGASSPSSTQRISRLVAVVDSPLLSLFEPVVEGGLRSGGAVIAFPAGSVDCFGTAGDVPQEDQSRQQQQHEYPVYVIAHLGETGECPEKQCVLYLTTPWTTGARGVLERCLGSLLAALGSSGPDSGTATGPGPSTNTTSDMAATATTATASSTAVGGDAARGEDEKGAETQTDLPPSSHTQPQQQPLSHLQPQGHSPACLYQLYYEQTGRGTKPGSDRGTSTTPNAETAGYHLSVAPGVNGGQVAALPPLPLDLTFDDGVFEPVREAWKLVVGSEAADGGNDVLYMVFEDRRGAGDDEDGDGGYV